MSNTLQSTIQLLTPYQQHVNNLDKELSKYPALNNFERQTSIPKVYVVLGLLALYFFLVFFNIAGEFLVNFAGFVIPGYYSLEALFSTSKADDTQVSGPPFFCSG
jgi:receptor expression-enhancing protein 5/6